MYTVPDAMSRLLLVNGLPQADPVQMQFARMAVSNAMLSILSKNDWRYYIRRATIVTTPEQSAGTVQYRHSGGAYPREVTLSGAVWPDWSEGQQLWIGGDPNVIATRESDTVVTLSDVANPGVDRPAGTSYRLARSIYPLPGQARKIGPIVQENTARRLTHLQAESMTWSMYTRSAGYPDSFCVRPGSDGLPSIELIPAPVARHVYVTTVLFDQRRPGFGFVPQSAGTLAISGNIATLTGATFPSHSVGAVLRASGVNGTLPTEPAGANPPVGEWVIERVLTSTTARLSTTGSVNAGASYTLADPVDIDEPSMRRLFDTLCDAEYLQLAGGSKFAPDRLAAIRQEAVMALREGMAAEQRLLPAPDQWGPASIQEEAAWIMIRGGNGGY